LLEEEGFKSTPERWSWWRRNNVCIPYSRSRNVECPTTDHRQSEWRHHQATDAGRA